MLRSTLSMRSANGRAASAADGARRSLDAATICMALVIFCVALVAAMRTRMSLSEGMVQINVGWAKSREVHKDGGLGARAILPTRIRRGRALAHPTRLRERLRIGIN